MKATATHYLRHYPDGKVQMIDELTGHPVSELMDARDPKAQAAIITPEQGAAFIAAQRRELEQPVRLEAGFALPQQNMAAHFVGGDPARQEAFAESASRAALGAQVNTRTGAVNLAIPGAFSGS